MRPESAEHGLNLTDNTLGVIRVKSPHNENPIGRFSVSKLKRVLSIAGKLGYDEVVLWNVRKEDAGMLFATREMDSNVAIAVAGLVE